ncbi:hypothetical protein MPTK1_6g16090 [Marchantia polymorpha subsp. ruderalis]|uniref:Uncharacterized protein n=2 Tax=Marchantia polymorpha TaxID=3197 RepID=A0AAF6BSK7_MARPO|nr:hypothetical protein MARPO_0056s0121 [Marchantia polymorpha]BBN14991.1 hypothetical protein Mp_6g16090 [Marchantia polymorpha subsp. ruderalis]|eukprot:PTQ37676.1 hypothetical protein MARPO_0056s0121 [Marchantia polymorpha]
MSNHDVRERHAQAKAQVAGLRERLQESRSRKADTDVATYARGNGRSAVKFSDDFRLCKTLQGHTGKIYSLDWAYQAEDRIVSASGDGRLIVWNALTSQKTHAIKLPCPWVMACAFSPRGRSVACGGLDNMCSIFNLSSPPDADGNLPVSQTLSGHKSYLSCCRYVPHSDNNIITSSGDETCILWDVDRSQKISTFGGEATSGHTAAVMSVSVSTVSTPQVFVSGSCDKTARLWDTRMKSAPQTYQGHDGDVNAVCFLPDGKRFGTASDDGTCRLFDTRTGYQLQMYSHPRGDSVKVLAVAFSSSGRLMFAAYDNEDCYVWDTIMSEVVTNLAEHRHGHEKRISCLGLSRDGSALCTGSWDNTLKVWAFSGRRNRD